MKYHSLIEALAIFYIEGLRTFFFIKGVDWTIQQFLVHYQIRGLGLFSLAFYEVIALPTIVTAIVALTRFKRR